MATVIDPVRIYEVKGQVCLLQTVVFSYAVANNQSIVAGVAGKIIRVMGYQCQTAGAAPGGFAMKNGSGGAFLLGPFTVPANTAGVVDRLPIVDSGYTETTAGTGLFIDVSTTAINFNIYYIVYTP